MSWLKVANASAGPGYYRVLGAGNLCNGRTKQWEPFLLTVHPRDVDRKKRFEHPGEEFIFVLSGRADYVVGSETFALGPGDSLIYSDAMRPHAPLPKGGPVTVSGYFLRAAATNRNQGTLTHDPFPIRKELIMSILTAHEEGKRLRIGVVGCGSHAYRSIFPCFDYLAAELVATCDVDLARAKKYAAHFGARSAHAKLADMIEAGGIDAVVLAVGPAQHPPLACEALNAGLHVWMEKSRPCAGCRRSRTHDCRA